MSMIQHVNVLIRGRKFRQVNRRRQRQHCFETLENRSLLAADALQLEFAYEPELPQAAAIQSEDMGAAERNGVAAESAPTPVSFENVSLRKQNLPKVRVGILQGAESTVNGAIVLTGEQSRLGVINNSAKTVRILGVSLEGADRSAFTLSGPSKSKLQPGQKAPFSVSPATNRSGLYEVTLVVRTNRPNFARIEVPLRLELRPDVNVVELNAKKAPGFIDHTFQVTNRGKGTLEFNPATWQVMDAIGLPSRNYAITSPLKPQVVPKDGSVDVVVRFTPNGVGTYRGKLEMQTNDSRNPLIIKQLADIADANLSVTIEGEFSKKLVVRNTGIFPLTVTGVRLETAHSPSPFALSSVATPFSLEYGQSRTFTVAFSTTQQGIYQADIVFTSNDTQSPVIRKKITTVAEPNMEVKFQGDLQMDGVQTVTVTSTGYLPLRVDVPFLDSGTSSHAFRLEAAPTSTKEVVRGQSLSFKVRFMPTEPGNYDSTLVIRSNDVDQRELRQRYVFYVNPEIAVRQGTGTIMQNGAHSPIVFNAVCAPFDYCPTIEKSFRIYNRGNFPLTVDRISIAHNQVPAFWTSLSGSKTIQPGGSLPFSLYFHGNAMKEWFTANVTIYSNDQSDSSYRFIVAGFYTEAIDQNEIPLLRTVALTRESGNLSDDGTDEFDLISARPVVERFVVTEPTTTVSAYATSIDLSLDSDEFWNGPLWDDLNDLSDEV